jgi:dephospho-CoA kinase
MKRKRRSKYTPPFIIGLTGSIGMGKTTVSRMFALQGVAVCDSDKIVHRLLASGGRAVEKVTQFFPQTRGEYGIDRTALGREVFGNPDALKKLESILHPLVWEEQKHFIAQMKRRGKRAVLLDIPLLFETGAEARCNAVLVADAPPFIQAQRVLARKGMTREKFMRVLARQMPNRQKRRLADRVINTGLGRAHSYRQVWEFLKKAFSSRAALTRMGR